MSKPKPLLSDLEVNEELFPNGVEKNKNSLKFCLHVIKRPGMGNSYVNGFVILRRSGLIEVVGFKTHQLSKYIEQFQEIQRIAEVLEPINKDYREYLYENS